MLLPKRCHVQPLTAWRGKITPPCPCRAPLVSSADNAIAS